MSFADVYKKVESHFEKLSRSKPQKQSFPALWATMAFCAGIIIAKYARPSVDILFYLILPVFVLVIFSFYSNNIYKTIVIFFICTFTGTLRESVELAPSPDDWSNYRSIESIRGTIINYPTFVNGRWSAVIAIIAVDCGEGFIGCKGKAMLRADSTFENLSYGQVWEIDRKPLPLEENRNFYSFDYAEKLRSDGINGSVALDGRSSKLLDEEGGTVFLRKVIAPVRKFVSVAIFSTLPGDRGGLLEGMILGGGKHISKTVTNLFRDTGVIHILSVSGMHVAVIAAAIFWVTRKLLKLKYVYSAITTAILVTFYCFLAELVPPVLRSGIMSFFVLFAPLVGRKSNIINIVAASGLFILIFIPSDLFDIGFQLSYAATFGIIYFLPRIGLFISDDFLKRRSYLFQGLQLFILTFAVQLASAPLTAWHFHKFQLVSPIANLLIVPPLLPIFAIGFFGIILFHIFAPIGNLIMQLDGLVLSYIIFSVKILGNLPFSFIPVAHPTFLSIIGFYSVSFGGINIFWNKYAKYLALFGLLLLIIPPVFIKNNPDIVFFKSKGELFYIGSGNNAGIVYANCPSDAIERTLLPFLNARGKSSVELLALPVSRTNDSANAERITQLLKPARILHPQDSFSVDEISLKFTSLKNCLAKIDNYTIAILLSPPETLPDADCYFIDIDKRANADSLFRIIPNRTVIFGNSKPPGYVSSKNIYSLDKSALRLGVGAQGSISITTP
jgi:ComEC/Rec2-related protein